VSVDALIRELVAGKDFADVGGLWGIMNEKVSCAANAKARSVTMIDITSEDAELWQQFREWCAERDVSNCRCIAADIHDDALGAACGPFDVVHCNGLLYHCARPLSALDRLRRLCAEHLILGTAVISTSTAGQSRSIQCEAGGALFVPGLLEKQREAAASYFHEVGAETMIGLDEPCDWNIDKYDPWWWLFTVEHVRGLLNVSGFNVRATWMTWNDRTAYFHASLR
jgi:2-polyprenyl-3-methyl-5-hydroxy-6-metoxy-1,4-benzoquinol methylase